MPTTIRLISALLPRVPTQRCYWKARWQDPWTEVPALWCNQAEWSAAPELPVAEFEWRYGIKLAPGSLNFGPQFRENNRLRFFVKVVYSIYSPGATDNPTTWTWIGVIDIELDDIHGPLFESIAAGDVVAFATGLNHFTAYGVESLLDCDRIRTSYVAGSSASGPHWVKRGLDFNKQGIDRHVIGNRSDVEVAGGGYAFHGSRTGASTWSTRTAIEYLLRRQTPADNSGEPQIPFVLYDPANVLPDWDEPVVAQDGRTTRELLNVFCARERIRGHYFDVEVVDGGPDRIRMRPFSFAENIMLLDNPSGASVPANEDQIILAFERDRGASCNVKRSAADRFDRVIARGAQRTSTATFSFEDNTLDIGWPLALELLYEQGASTAADYAGLDGVAYQNQRNMDARKADKVRPVYSRFVLRDPFTYIVGDGLGAPDQWLTPDDLTAADDFVRIAPEDRQFLPHLALRAGFDYTSTNVGLGTITAHAPGAHHYLEPIVLFPRYDWTEDAPRYRHAESTGINGEEEIESVENLTSFTANVRVDHQDGSLWIVLTNQPQHAIAQTDFAQLAADREAADLNPIGSGDFRKMVCTLTVAWSEFVEQAWPEELPFGYDVIRTMTIEAGDDYRLDYIVPGTITQLDPKTGEPQRSTGGYLRDDRKQLQAIARLAYEWYGQTRRAVTLETTTIDTRLQLGQLVVSLGDPAIAGDVVTDEVRSCITSLRVESPLVISDGTAQPAAVKLHLITAYAELDPLALGTGKQ